MRVRLGVWPQIRNEVEEWLSKRWQNVLRARGIAGPVVPMLLG